MREILQLNVFIDNSNILCTGISTWTDFIHRKCYFFCTGNTPVKVIENAAYSVASGLVVLV